MKFNLHKFIEIVSTVGPVVLATIPGGDKIAPMIPRIVEGINAAEAIKGASGADKKRHVLNVVEQAIGVANQTGKVSISAEEVKAITSQGIDTVVATVHVIEGAKVVKVGATAPAAASSLPGVDTAARASDLAGGHATHGHGSADHLPPAGGTADAAGTVNTGNAPASDPPPSEAFEGGANRPPNT